MKTLQPTEYLYGSARIRALENHLVGRERIEALLDARSSDEIMAKLAEYGLAPAEGHVAGSSAEADTVSVATMGETRSRAREAMLLAVLRTAYREVEESAPDAGVFRFFRYPYDCNNLKAAIKCLIRGLEAGGMLFDFGTVPAADVTAAVREGNFSLFPPSMAEAAPRAKEAYAKTGDPRQIDSVLDRACYEDMLRDAKAGDPSMAEWVVAKIDLVNIMICLRVLRMKQGERGKMLLGDMLLSGGRLNAGFFDSCYAEGETALWDALAVSAYSKLADAVEGTDRSLAAIEKCADDHWMETVRRSARVSFGATVLGGYLVGCETAVKNIRILLAAKDAGLSADVIRERIRESYV